jgi:cellulose synthase (UDP-forming)
MTSPKLRVNQIYDYKYFYALDKHDSDVVRLSGFFSLISLIFLIIGYIKFFGISLLVGTLFAPVFILIVAYLFIQGCLLLQYSGFDVKKHQARVEKYREFAASNNFYPNVAVLIPVAGEDKTIVANTLDAALSIYYPHSRVYILDDSQKADYADLARSSGSGYIRRPDVGRFQKSGNLNFALSTLSGYDYFLILDADFKARPEIINELLPYAGKDVGIVQSPQHFPMHQGVYNRSMVEYGSAYIQQDFYRIVQVARDKFGASICVGTNALYNVEALKKVGGFEGVGAHRGWGHSEDINTGLKIIHEQNSEGKRYKIKYIPIQLAEGYCPDNHHSFYKQQNRWCTGSIQLLLNRKTTFSSTLTLPQRIIYGSNALYYYYSMALVATPLYLLVLMLLNKQSSWRYTLFFLPILVTTYLIIPFLLRKKRRPFALSFVVLSNTYTFIQALLLLIQRKPLNWEATGSLQNRHSTHFTQFKLIVVLVYMLIYLPTFGVVLINDKSVFGPLMFLIGTFLFTFIAHIIFLYYILIGNSHSSHRLADRKFYAAIAISAATIFVSYIGIDYHSTYQVEFNKGSIVKIKKLNMDNLVSIK